ncbi:hypothetical protein E3V35_09225 [Streptococcus pseudopneumoniae]|nr:hypothetical protein E3V35_09225 [Streptococcus pseudopneumoniae]
MSSNFLTQSLSGLKYALASFFKPSHRCGGETTKSNSSSYRFYLIFLFLNSGFKVPRTFLAYLFPCSG